MVKRLLALFMLAIMLIPLALVNSEESVAALSQTGSRGEQARRIQRRLDTLGYYNGKIDGVFGTQTRSALVNFQRAKGITADGVAGVVTLTALDIVFKQGSTGEDVSTIQRRLKNLGYYTGSIDAKFGSVTASAVRAFQRDNNLTADGIVGFATAKRLFSSSASSRPTGGSYSDSDYELLARIINGEARGEPYRGQVAVGAVVLNRVEHPSFPNTVAGVIYQKGAFTAVSDGQIDVAIEESSYRAAREALSGYDPTGGAIYYYNPDKTSNKWIRTRTVISVIGRHLFCV